MYILLSYIGILPNYTIECVHQIRLYFKGLIYLITDDLNEKYNLLNRLINDYNVIIINYNLVRSIEFDGLMKINEHNIEYLVKEKNGRQFLFKRALERFYLAHNFMNLLNLNDVFFMEIDNLIYDNPEKWLNNFKQKDFCFMCHTPSECSSGICYIKNKNSLIPFISVLNEYILEAKLGKFYSEMRGLRLLYEKYPNYVSLLPSIYPNDKTDELTYKNYDLYRSIFDPACYGIYIMGEDRIHNNGNLIKNKAMKHHLIYCSDYEYKWDIDIDGLKKPYIYNKNNNEWILINNLHVHAKNLDEGLSKPLVS